MRKPVVIIVAFVILIGTADVAGAESDRIVFPHATHFAEEVDCATCHADAASSTVAADRLLPDMELCADCHDVEDEATCTMCHTNPDEAGDYPARAFGAGFGHAAHLDRGMDCAACHGDPARDRPALPDKADCRTCHVTAADFADCRLCHTGAEPTVPATHDLSWAHMHGLAAHADPGRCYQCHTENGCQKCHAGDNVRPRSHGLDFAFSHGAVARANEMECATCHADPQYCSSCHVAERVYPRSHSSAGWVGGDGGRHAVDAQFELENCIACHDQGEQSPSCAGCHGG